METEKKFKTKTGFCHITDERIVLTRDGVIGNVSKVVVGNSIFRILIVYILVSIGLFYFAYNSFVNGDQPFAIFFGIIGLYLIYGILKSLNNSATPIIEKKDIKSVVFKRGTSGMTRSRFEINFEENGKLKKRLILLPGLLTGGEDETEKAFKIMNEEKLLG